ncbi:MAG TPA: tRNA uridine-5-carboxymethylaminomethyl(34) synthesis GTPase MnmE [Gammaproteobacteria bacterium]|nr:tRNA uridine-5-carboxymethylaminomethyl(34) synthesis GTPase MnmE [Gammaproteobacteria bacterium]
MEQNDADTIVAEATPRGRGGVGVVRISGSKTTEIAQKILGRLPSVGEAKHLLFLDKNNEGIDRGIALLFKAPHSFTGEDVLELQGHGGPVIMDLLVQAAIDAGARNAEPGEFSLRAYLNNKIDLCQAEAIADLINASSKEAAKSALRSLQGVFSDAIQTLVEKLIKLRMHVEAAIDFPEEEIDFLKDDRICVTLKALMAELETIQEKAFQGSLRSDGARVVIVGHPNAGKSSLLNALSGTDAAIVTDIPGTTRDVLREQIVIDGLLVQLVDTAGLRVGADPVEKEGIARALKEVSLADHVVLVVDGATTTETQPTLLFSEWIAVFPKNIGMTVLMNKIDKWGAMPSLNKKSDHTVIHLSVKTGEGLSLFKEHLKKSVGFDSVSEGNFMARRRHLEALSEAKQHLIAGERQLHEFKAGELLAEELRLAQLALDRITGKFSSDDLLGKIFSEFCIGK